MQKHRRPVSRLLVLIPFAVCAVVLILWMTPYGLGVSPDSVTYLETAKSILTGNGFLAYRKPMTHFPPVYPLLLAIAGRLHHGDVFQASRFLHMLLFGANVMLVGVAVQMCTQGSVVAAASAMLLFLTSAPVVLTHSMAWSEPLFITFSLASHVLLSSYVARPRLYLLLSGAVGVGLAVATRYIGLSLLPPMVFALLAHRTISNRLRDVVVATAVACTPISLWSLRNLGVAQTTANRTFAFHPVNSDFAKTLIVTLHDFALPVSIPGWAKAAHLAVAALIFLAALVALRRQDHLQWNADSLRIVLPSFCLVSILTYIAFLIVSVSFFDALTPANARILLPIFILFIVAAVPLAWSLSQAFRKREIWRSFTLCVLFLAHLNAWPTVAQAMSMHLNGAGYASRQWNNSPTLSSVKSLSSKLRIYSNGWDVVRFQTGQEAAAIPCHTNPTTLRPNDDYELRLQTMCGECAAGQAVVVYLHNITGRCVPAEEELESACGLQVLASLDDGVIYGTTLSTLPSP